MQLGLFLRIYLWSSLNKVNGQLNKLLLFHHGSISLDLSASPLSFHPKAISCLPLDLTQFSLAIITSKKVISISTLLPSPPINIWFQLHVQTDIDTDSDLVFLPSFPSANRLFQSIRSLIISSVQFHSLFSIMTSALQWDFFWMIHCFHTSFTPMEEPLVALQNARKEIPLRPLRNCRKMSSLITLIVLDYRLSLLPISPYSLFLFSLLLIISFLLMLRSTVSISCELIPLWAAPFLCWGYSSPILKPTPLSSIC